MDNNKLAPAIDLEILQKKANEYAMKGAEESIKEFYTGWNSPYRKALDEELKKQEIGTGLQLPDIIALINNTLSKAVDEIANTAIAKTFLPQVQRFLTRVDPEIKFSDILKEFIEEDEHDIDRDSCECSITKDAKYGWLDIEISDSKRSYKFVLHEDYEAKKEGITKYKALRLPSEFYSERYGEKMTLSVDGVKLELPFTRDVLKDGFVTHMARLVLCDSAITMDCDGFEDDMFPERCHCH